MQLSFELLIRDGITSPDKNKTLAPNDDYGTCQNKLVYFQLYQKLEGCWTDT